MSNKLNATRRVVSGTLECGHEYTHSLGGKHPFPSEAHCAACAVNAPPSGEDARMREAEAELRAFLPLAVGLWVQRFRDEKATLDEVMAEGRRCGEIIASHGDALMFRTKEKKDAPGTHAVFNALARGLACASFVPGGARAFGLHFESRPEWLTPAPPKKRRAR